MKLIAKADILLDKRIKTGTKFDANEDQAKTLIEYGFAEEVKAEPKAPARKTTKKG